MPVRFSGGGSVSVGSENPTDSFTITIRISETNLAPADATSFAFTFNDTIASLTDALALRFTFADVNVAPTDSLLGLRITFSDTNASPADASTFVLNFLTSDTIGLPADAIKLSFSFADAVALPVDGRDSLAYFWLSGSAGSGVTNPANANGSNDAVRAVISTAALGSATETMLSNCGNAVPSGVPFTNCLFRAYFNCSVPLATSTVRIIALSSSALFATTTIFSTTAAVNHDGGTFTYDLFNLTPQVDSIAKVQSLQFQFQTQDAVAGVTPAVLNVDAARIEVNDIIA